MMAKYTPRTTAPSTSDKYWIQETKGGYSTCILISGNSVLPNCVGYAHGRLREIVSDKKIWSPIGSYLAGHAENWLDSAQKHGFKTGKTPKLGSVIVYAKGKTHCEEDGCGHVAVVEEIKPNGDIVTSNSAYKGRRFFMQTMTKASGYYFGKGYTFLGFVYCGIEFDNKPEPITPDKPSGSIVAGKTVILKNTPCYSSESAKEHYGTKSGTYFLWDNVVKNGRIRITNAASRVGVPGQVTCWVNVSDIGLQGTAAAKPAAKPAYQGIHTVKKGDTLWGLAEKYLGKGTRYKEIMSINGLKSDVLSIGQKLKIPNR